MEPGNSRCIFRLKFIEYGSVRFGFTTLISNGSNAEKLTACPLVGATNGEGTSAVLPAGDVDVRIDEAGAAADIRRAEAGDQKRRRAELLQPEFLFGND